MSRLRIIPRLDIKGPNLIKAVQLEGLRVIGDPNEYARKYYEQGADELIYMDTVASLYGRNNLTDIVTRAVENIFIPITVGGGVRSVEDAMVVLRSGADKIAVNTAAIRQPQLVNDLANKFGSQCVVLSVEAKSLGCDSWEAYVDNGRERTGLNVIDWVQQAVSLGAGEVLLTSVDREGTRLGFDVELIKKVTSAVSVPVIASGGMGEVSHIKQPLNVGSNAIAIADLLHYDRATVSELRQYSKELGFV